MILAFTALEGGPAPGLVAPVGEENTLDLVAAAQRGDRDAARRLWTTHVRRVWRGVRPLCATDADAEDVVQETFAKAFGALDRFTPRPDAQFVSWLLAIALNTLRKRARKLGRQELVDPSMLQRLQEPTARSADDPAGEAMDRARLRDALFTALAELPERERQVITLRYGAELSAREVARVCGLGEANVRKICERRRPALSARIERILTETPR